MSSSTLSNNPHPLHFVVIPFMAQGHLLPLVDISRLLAQRKHVQVTLILTTRNVTKVKTIIDRDQDQLWTPTRTGSYRHSTPSLVNIVEVKFPSQESGLPEGVESVDMLDSMADLVKFFNAANTLEEQVMNAIKDFELPPSCIIGDMSLPFTSNLAKNFKIPKILFHGFSCFSLMCIQVVRNSGILNVIESNDEYFALPNLPDKVEFTKPQVSVLQPCEGDRKESTEKIIEADVDSYGVIVNSFEELEEDYVKEYKKVRDGKVWCVGPVSLCNKLGLDKAERGDKACIDQEQCLKWLDSQETGSVLYVCLGSLCNLSLIQLKELGLGLEESNKRFIWVLREWGKYEELANWIQEFEIRVQEKGIVIKGWAPQVLILSHKAVGGFLSHCGWNSTLEGITAGIPLLTWPLFAEQFCNEKLVVEILKVGVKIGIEKSRGHKKDEEEIGGLICKESVRKGVEEVMGDSEEAKERRRRRVKEFGELANKALEEGGSSYGNMTLLIEDIMEYSSSKI